MWLGRPDTTSTWEKSSSLPSKLVEDYERGVQYSIETYSFTSGGETFHTLATKPGDTLPSPKRTKVDITTSTMG